jgi:hypothetical protein
MPLHFAASVLQTLFHFHLLCYGFKKQSLATVDFVLWNREVSWVWLLAEWIFT